MRTHRLIAMAGLLMSTAACEGFLSPAELACTTELRPAFRLTVRDSHGQPAAIGTTVRVVGPGGVADTVEGWADPLMIHSSNLGSGTFDLYVSRPWHAPVALSDVKVRDDGCHPILKDVAVRLDLLPDAPAVRQVVLPSHGFGFGWGNLTASLSPQVIAAPGVSQGVTWLSRDESVVTVSANGEIRSRCRATYGSAWVLASSAVDASVSDSVAVTVYADTDPVRCPAP